MGKSRVRVVVKVFCGIILVLLIRLSTGPHGFVKTKCLHGHTETYIKCPGGPISETIGRPI